jgi:L-fuconolactonase
VVLTEYLKHYNADLTAPAVADAAAALRELPGGELLCGIRHPVLAEADPGWLARPAVLHGLQALAAAGLGFDIVTLPNVTCKLSGAHTTSADASDLRPYYQAVLTACGPDRLMFGSDWPVSTIAAPHGQVCALYQELTAQLSPAEQDAIFDRTARRVYRLPGPEAPPQQQP